MHISTSRLQVQLLFQSSEFHNSVSHIQVSALLSVYEYCFRSSNQRCYSCGVMNNNHKMVGGSSNKTSSAERQKQKSIASVRKPVSMQSSFDGDRHGGAEVGSKQGVKSSALDYSHFISLPLAIHPQLVDKLVNFQNSILGLHDNSSNKASTSSSKQKTSSLSELGIDKSIFIKPKTFHLTVLMLKLWNKERVDAAVKIFEGIAGEIMDALDGRSVSIKLKGLDCMKGSFAKARVLYAPVEVVGGEDRLLRACKVITEAFTKGGLVLEKDVKQTLKLHATVMNVRHRKRTKMTNQYDSFDARGVMEKYGSEDWGRYLIREVHLSQRFVFDEDGYYHCCASIPLPHNVHKCMKWFCI
ncbi:unnamed protein product [Lactuca virosa]|uniref:A-kinase anchor protein 7-like phosphoesterase domain-containing protein n=1 Tax=Lactuca virosa TaxID=75947 RepID=A0AAU9NXL4_9ASTR|nr:unnamed protein product [Lactuca virosa]